MNGNSIYYFYFILSQAIWGVLPAFWLLMRQLPPLYTLSSRIVWASLFCFLLILQKKLVPSLKGVKHERWQWPYIAGACIFITLNWGSYIYATTQGFILQASLAYFINPIVLVFFGGLLFHEKLRFVQKLSVAVAVTGVALAFFRYGVVPWLSLFICLTWATYSMLKKKIRLDSQVSVFIESFSMVPLALAFIAFCEMNGSGAVGTFHGWQWLLLPATGVVTAVPMMLFSAGVKGVPITTAGILMYLSPSITLVIGLLSGESITPPLLVTFTFAWAAVALYVYGIYQTMRGLAHGGSHRQT